MNKMFEKSKLLNKLPKDDPECSYVNSMMEMSTNLLREMCSKSGEHFDKLHGVVPKCKLPIGYDFGEILLTSSVIKSSHDQKDNKSSIQLSSTNCSSLLPTEVDALDSIDEKNNTVIETVTNDLMLSSDEEEYFHDDENNHVPNTNTIIDSGKGDSEKIIFDTLNKCSSKIPKVHSLSLFRKHYDNNTFDNTNQTESNHNNKKDPSDDASCTGDTEPFEDSNESAKPKQQDVMKLIELLTSSKPEIKLSTFEPIYNEINRKRQAMKTKKDDKTVSQPKKPRYVVEKVENSMELRINIIPEWAKDFNIEALTESIKKRQSVKEQTKSTNSVLRPTFATQESLPFNVSENTIKRENSKLMMAGSANQPTQNHQQQNLFGGTNIMSTTGASGNESNCVKKPQATAKQIFLPSNYGNSLQKVAVVTGKVNKETAVGLNSFQNQIIFHHNQHQSASQQQQQNQSHHQHQNASQQHHQQQNNQHHQNESLINNPQQQQSQSQKEQHNHQQQQKSHQQKLRQMAAKDANQRALNANENEADEQKVVEGLRAIEKLRLSIKSEFITRMRALDTEKWLREADGHKENADKVKGKLEYPPMIILAVRKYLIYNYSLDVKEQYKKCHETYLKNAEFVCQITKNLELVYKDHINKITDPNSSCLWNLKLIKWFTMTMCMKLSAILQYRAFRNVSPKCKEIHCWLRKNGILDKDGRTSTLLTNSDQAVNNSPFSVLSSSYYYSPGRNSSPRGTTPAANQRGGGQSTVTGTTMMVNATTSSVATGVSGAGSSSIGSAVNFTNEMKTKLQTYIDHTGIINNSYNDWMKAEKNLATFCEKSIRHEEAWRDIEWKIIEKTGGITINGIDESMAFVIKYLEGFINYMNEFQKNLHPPRLFQFSDSNRLIS